MIKAKPITLALSGGGARCAAHAGVLSVLDDVRIPVEAIAGVSGGGLVGVLYALGYSPITIRDYFADTQLLDVWEFDASRRAMFGTEKIRARTRQMVGDKTFADLKFPVTLIATDLYSGREVHLTRGSLLDAILATTAIPAVIAPQKINGMLLVDGGVVNPLPVNVARRMGKRVVAVELGSHNRSPDQYTQLFEARGPMQVATEIAKRLQVVGIMESAHQANVITSQRFIEMLITLHPPEVLIRPEVGQMGLFAFDLSDEAYKQGEAATRAQQTQLEALARPTFKSQIDSMWKRVIQKPSRSWRP